MKTSLRSNMTNPIQDIANSKYPPKYPFEDFLRSMHAEDYHGTDDDMPDAFDDWLTNLEPEELISYGNQALNMALNINKNE